MQDIHHVKGDHMACQLLAIYLQQSTQLQIIYHSIHNDWWVRQKIKETTHYSTTHAAQVYGYVCTSHSVSILIGSVHKRL